ncbi:tumor necrosis factor receptor superfamily member 17 [Nothoprocta perdicaria]|uniref:tumor necrosis factor receptor superfamily member 17 n=1 Tax=Nothoprocta perdicaria TaxID=30464 RepID=UPI000E1C2228|nr:tumor necrosis factor receptor superfamily member 17 [Nothoprocta perdicaria]
MAQCPPSEYFDNLLFSCKPCHLRCAGTPPRPCEQHCHKGTESGGVLWIYLGIGVILVLTLFLLMVLFKRKHLKQLKEKLKYTEPCAEPRAAARSYSVQECTCSDCGPRQPLPATEEGAAALVTTKSSDDCSYVLGAG